MKVGEPAIGEESAKFTLTSFAVPWIVTELPNAVATVDDPSPNVIELLLSFAFVILPASCALLTPSALMLTYPLAEPKSALLKLAIPFTAVPEVAAAVASLKESLLCAIAALAFTSAFTIAPALI